MKFRRYKINEDYFIALKHESKWRPLAEHLGRNNDMLAFLERWPGLKSEVTTALEDTSADAPQLPHDARPVPPFEVRSLRDFMLFEAHAVNAAKGMVRRFMPRSYFWLKLVETVTRRPYKALKPHPLWYRQPIYYFGNHLNLVGDGGEIPWPSYTRHLDYELELAFVITKPLLNATPEAAAAAIGGFMVLNDVSARDIQVPEMRSGMGPQKAKHFVNAMSDEVTPAGEVLPYIDQLKGEVRINDELVCRTSTRGMQHSIIQMLVHSSRDEQLHPGEVFATGTLPGGCALENGHWLKPGDRIEMTIERVGTLRNRIASKGLLL